MKPRHFTAQCKFHGKASGANMIQCHMCQAWFHYPCVNEKQVNIVEIWSCHVCRCIGRSVSGISDKLSSMKNTVRFPGEQNSLIAIGDRTGQSRRRATPGKQHLRDELAGISNMAEMSIRPDTISDHQVRSTALAATTPDTFQGKGPGEDLATG